ncbi:MULTISPECIES: FAD-dependent oxidoreductase [unclassified Cobetia]|uniref:FAD-dependent oxidoreductase n=1 Tax=unclassified Cobetia TaxID=2609414 RepID=UPI002096D958|nr:MULTISPECIES: FAD-dependent oxidoreductase [unclassified Cobetia]MCO7231698.1 FAD-dependent oxidoreductase [Cobetia sp. Dlab-2-AX]MCO7234986.1 FAD-dependent oxidoreductase [Cobetia sp. Dlab-2-U]
MQDVIETDVLVIGEGAAGLTAALAAHEQGAQVTLLYSGQASSTAISTGFVTYAAHEDISQDDILEAMAHTTGKGLCDMPLLERLVREGPLEMAETIESYEIPVDKAPRGYRVKRSTGRRGKDMLNEDYGADGANDMTGLMMEFSSTHGTALFSQLRKAIRKTDVQRLRGSALSLSAEGPSAWAIIDGKAVKIAARAVIIATGGMQGVYDFTDTPRNLLGDGQAMALEAGASLVDMEFIQFYPLAVCEEGVPAIFMYPDYPETAVLINSDGEDLIEKHIGGSTTLGALHNWDQLSFIMQSEIVRGQKVYVDFRHTREEEWAPDSLTATFLSKYIPDFRQRAIGVAPSSHYTIGGIQVDINGQTRLPGIYACGEVAGGIHGANRHGGTALVEAITYGRISGRHAAHHLRPRTPASLAREDAPVTTSAGTPARVDEALDRIRRINQHALGPFRSAALLQAARGDIAALQREVDGFGWQSLDEYAAILRVKRVLMLSEAMRQSMLRRTETRGTHTRSDYPEASRGWLKKQLVRLSRDDGLVLDDVILSQYSDSPAGSVHEREASQA